MRGVKAVINGIQVNPFPSRRGWETRDDIQDALLSTPATESLEILVRVEKGKVTLSGTVDSWQERESAEKVAKGVKGVAIIENNITVRIPSTRPDNEIKGDIEEKSKWDALVDHALIDVKVKMGGVYLSGVVGSAAEKRQAKIDALAGAGVKSVDVSDLKVNAWAPGEDLRRNKISVMEAKRAAAQDAQKTIGVVRVKNRLRVKPVTPIPDIKIGDQVRNGLFRDPYLEHHEITEIVIDGMVYLGGTVDTYYEKAQAEEVASRVKGVVAGE